MTEKQAIYYAARPLFEQALAIDPNYADALAGDAMTSIWSITSTTEFGRD